jgi:hypothetical protein
MKSLDARLGALERACGDPDESPIVVVIGRAASEDQVEAAIQQAVEDGPGQPTFTGQRLYVVHLRGGKSEGRDGP